MRILTGFVAVSALAVAAVFPTGAAFAEGPPVDYTRDGWYLQGQGLYAMDYFKNGDRSAASGAGFSVTGGWRGWKLFAGEVEWEYINQFMDGPADMNTYNISFLLKLYPLAWAFSGDSWFQRFQPYLRAGPAWQFIDIEQENVFRETEGSFAGRFGAGLDIYATQNAVITLGASFMLPSTSPVNDYRYLSLGGGFQWRFGPSD